jgi:ribosomal protein S18 acetylase RimI-like enzyme
MKIRDMALRDIEDILSIGKKVGEFSVDDAIEGFWTEEQLTRWVESEKDVLLVAEENKEIIGFVTFAHHVPTGKVTFENAWIDEKHRRTDLIKDLTNEGLERLKKFGASYICGLAKTDNLASVKFLQKLNFSKGFDFTWLHRKI